MTTNITFTPSQNPFTDSRITQSNAGSTQVDASGFLKQTTSLTTNLLRYNGAIDKAQSLSITIKAAGGGTPEFVSPNTRIDMYVLYTDASNNVRFTITHNATNSNDLKIIRTVGGSQTSTTILAAASDSYFVDGDVLVLEASWVSTTATFTFKKNGATIGTPPTAASFALTTGVPAMMMNSGTGTGTQTSNFQVTGETAGPDIVAPTFSTGPANTVTGSTTASVAYTSNESGTGSTVVTASGASQPADATFDAAATAITSATLKTDNITGLAAASLLKAWVQIKDAAGNRTTSSVMILTGHSGYSRTVVTTPNATASRRITSSPDIAAGDIIDYGSVVGAGTVVVNSDATFDSSSTVTQFTAYVGSLTDGWGAAGIQSVGASVGIVGSSSGFTASGFAASGLTAKSLTAAGLYKSFGIQ